MSRIRASNTQPERRLRSALWSLGLRFRLNGKLPGKPDIVFTRARLAVFVDGCFWHGCPIHGTHPKTNQSYWHPKIARNKARDEEVIESLRQLGWTGHRVWEHEVASNLDEVVNHIASLWRSATSSVEPGAAKSKMPTP